MQTECILSIRIKCAKFSVEWKTLHYFLQVGFAIQIQGGGELLFASIPWLWRTQGGAC